MRKRKLNVLKFVVSIMLVCSIIITSNPVIVEAGALEDYKMALDAITIMDQIYINDRENHPDVRNITTYDEDMTNEVKEMAEAGFKLWALDNLKIPSEAVINSIKVIPFTYELAYEDMNPYYALIVNYIYAYGGLTLEEFADYKYYVVIDYSGMNELGGYKRHSVCGIVGSERSELRLTTAFNTIYANMQFLMFKYSDQPQTTIVY